MITTLLAQTNFDLSNNVGAGFNVVTGYTLPDIISAALTLILIVAALIFFFMLVIGGVRWISSGGDKGQTEAARGQITAALVGLVIVFAAWAIVQLLDTFFGISILRGLNVPTVGQ